MRAASRWRCRWCSVRSDLTPEEIATTATVSLEQKDGGFAITKVHLDVTAKVPGADEEAFQEAANGREGELPRLEAAECRDHDGRQAEPSSEAVSVELAGAIPGIGARERVKAHAASASRRPAAPRAARVGRAVAASAKTGAERFAVTRDPRFLARPPDEGTDPSRCACHRSGKVSPGGRVAGARRDRVQVTVDIRRRRGDAGGGLPSITKAVVVASRRHSAHGRWPAARATASSRKKSSV